MSVVFRYRKCLACSRPLPWDARALCYRCSQPKDREPTTAWRRGRIRDRELVAQKTPPTGDEPAEG